MSHKRPHGNVSRSHLYAGAGGILAVIALVTALAFGFTTSAQDYNYGGGSDPAASCTASGGTWTGTMCNMPGSTSGVTCPNGSTHSAGYACTGPDNCSSAMTWCAVENVCKPTGSTCGTTTGGTTNPASYTGNQSGCTGAGFLWCPTVNDCFPAGSTCPTTTGGTNGATCAAGQIQCPAVGTSPAGCYSTCPTATGTTNTQTCTGGQIYCPAVGTFQAGCYTGSCPTIGQSCAAGQYWDAPTNSCRTGTSTTGTVQCPALGGRTVTPQECANATPVCAAGTQPSSTNPCRSAADTVNTQTCSGGQIFCPAVGTFQAGCYTGSCPTIGQSCAQGQYWNAATNSCSTSGTTTQTVQCPSLGGRTVTPQECANATPVCAAGTQPSSTNPCRQEAMFDTTYQRPPECAAGQDPMRDRCMPRPTNNFNQGDGQYQQACPPVAAEFCQFGFEFANGCPVGCRQGEIPECAAGQFPSPQNPCRPTGGFHPFPMPPFEGMNGRGMNGQGTQGFQFTPPPVCAQGQKPTFEAPCMMDFFNSSFGGPQFQIGDQAFDPTAAFGQFQDQYQFNPEDFEFRGGMSTRQVAREAKMLAGELKRMVKEINRESSRAAGLTACPGVTEALAFATELQSRVDIFSAGVTEENKEDVWGLIQDSRENLFQAMPEIMPKLGMCVGSTHMLKELSRCESEIAKLAQGAPDEAVAELQLRLADVAALKANPFEGVDFNNFDPADMMDRVDNLCGMGLDDVRQVVFEQHGTQATCGELERMGQEISAFVNGEMPDDMPRSVLAKAQKVAPLALDVIESALNEGSSDACEDAMYNLSQLEREVFGDTERDQGEFDISFAPDEEDMLRRQIELALTEGQDIDAIVESISRDILSKVKNQVTLVANRYFNDMATKLATANIKVQEASKSFDNIAVALSKETLNETLENRNQLADVVQEAAPLVPENAQDAFAALTDNVLRYNWTSDATAELKADFDGLANFLASGPEVTEVRAVFSEFEKDLQARYQRDIEDQHEDGLIPFADTSDPSQFYFDDLAILKTAGIVQGTATSGGDLVEPGRAINCAEAGAMFARAFALEGEGQVSAQVPTWAQDEAAALAAANVDFVQDSRFNMASTCDRGQLFHMAIQVMQAQNVDLPEVNCETTSFSDMSCAHPYARDALMLNEMGIVAGFPDGTMRLDTDLNRAQAATVLNEALTNPEVNAVIAE